MAVLDKFTVEVIVDGQPCNEYDDDEDPGPTKPHHITRYVEAVSGRIFKFRVFIAPNYEFHDEDMIKATVYMDGKRAGGKCIYKENFSSLHGVTAEIRGSHSGQGDAAKLLQYAFADLETREALSGDDAITLKSKYEKLGSMTVKLKRAAFVCLNDHPSDGKAPSLEVVPEKALKGRPLEVATTFKAKPARRQASVRSRNLDNHSMVTFHFKYRTRKALQSLMIIERSPSPIPLEEKPIESLTHEEAIERLRKQQENGIAKPDRRSVKRERSESNILPARPLKSSKGSNGATVYHIDSDEE